MQNCNAVKKQM